MVRKHLDSNMDTYLFKFKSYQTNNFNLKQLRNLNISCNFYVNNLIKSDILLHKDEILDMCKIKNLDIYLDKFLIWISNIWFLTITDRRYNRNFDNYVCLSAKIMEQLIGIQYRTKSKMFLLRKGIIECNYHFIKGHRCMGFRLAKKYRDLLKEGKLKFHVEKTRINTKKYSLDLSTEALRYLNEQLNNVTIDEKKAEKLIKMQEKDKSNTALDSYRFTVDAFVNKRHYQIRSKKCGRVFNHITNLPRFLRGTIKLYGKPLYNVDIKSCQPLLLTLLYNKKSKENIKYKSLVESGSFYQSICSYLKWKWNEKTKEDIKSITWKYAFGRNENKKKNKFIDDYFRDSFPELRQLIYEFKLKLFVKEERSHAKLPIFLQKMESSAIIDELVTLFSKLKIPILTIHDSFLCHKEDIEIVKQYTVQTFQKMFNLTPSIDVKSLT